MTRVGVNQRLLNLLRLHTWYHTRNFSYTTNIFSLLLKCKYFLYIFLGNKYHVR